MPKFEPKQIQQELDGGQLWPVYWLYGQERMKARELLKRIRRAALGTETPDPMGFGEESLDGAEVSASEIVDSAQSLSLGGGTRLVIVRDAHAVKESELLAPLLGPRAKKDELSSVCVFLSKDLDGRKKFSKLLVEKAAVVACEEVAEGEREAWIQYLSKRRGLELKPADVAALTVLDPWGLDIIDSELEKYELARGAGDDPSQVFLQGSGQAGSGEEFLNAFFARDAKGALAAVEAFADRPEESLPLLGLLSWNVRQLALGSRFAKLPPHLMDRFRGWSQKWSLPEIIELQEELARIDFSLKQTPRLPLALWSGLVLRFAQPRSA